MNWNEALKELDGRREKALLGGGQTARCGQADGQRED